MEPGLDTPERSVVDATVAARAPRIAESLPGVALVCDLVEENWPSMNLVAEMLHGQLLAEHADQVAVSRLCPPMRRRLTGADVAAGRRFNADRLMNRMWDYPRWIRGRRSEFDLFHLVDHSYAQLVHELPAERTIVTCHDLDTFRCLLEPEREPRSTFFKSMTRRILEGVRKAARVTCDSAATRDELLAYGLVSPERLRLIRLGVHPVFNATRGTNEAESRAAQLLGSVDSGMHGDTGDAAPLDVLHVGSTIARKRIDVLLRVFANVRKEFPRARLVRVGGAFAPAQSALVRQLGLDDAVVVMPFLERETLAAVYRRAAVVVLPAESEGFGLPLVEALACGAPVVASDIKALREVGGAAATYCRVGDVQEWTGVVGALLDERRHRPERGVVRRAAGIAQASKFSWAECARKFVEVYAEVLAS